MKIRCGISLVIGLAMLILALPYLSFEGNMEETIFSFAWLALAFDAPVVGIWSPPTKNAPFICLEPWYGRCDRAGYEGDYRDKDWINRLAPGERFSSVYSIEIA